MPLPALRPTDAVPIEHEGETYICLNDTTGTVEEQMLLSPMAYLVACHLTGFNDVADIQSMIREQYSGVAVPEANIVEIVDHLDRHGFLFTPAFERKRREVEEKFRQTPIRPSYLAGKSYPESAEELRTFLDKQFVREGGPGKSPMGTDGGGEALPGLIVPHIDFQRGGHSYAHGYLAMADRGKPDTVFVFGVAHAAERVPFILTRKDFETPFGVVETDGDIVARLEKACTWDPYAFELTHRTEHSIEFHAVMLAYLYGDGVKIVPILCSMFSEDPSMDDPCSIDGVSRFLEECARCVQDEGKRISVVAAADLAHVGKRFGDPFDIDDAVVQAVASRDEEDLSYVDLIDSKGFYASVMKDRNERKVCGLNCIYATLKTLEGRGLKGERLYYGYAHDPAGGIVSFASAILK